MEPKNHPIEKEIIFQTIICRFHVNLPGCTCGSEVFLFELFFSLLMCIFFTFGGNVLPQTENVLQVNRDHLMIFSKIQMVPFSMEVKDHQQK